MEMPHVEIAEIAVKNGGECRLLALRRGGGREQGSVDNAPNIMKVQDGQTSGMCGGSVH